jgi:putative SOS response-associated peptidase YedK
MCGRVRLSSDVSEIKLVFSIPPHRPTPNIAPSWNVAPTDPLPVVRYDARAGERSLDVMRWGLVPFWAKDVKVGFSNVNAKAEGIEGKPAFREAFQRCPSCPSIISMSRRRMRPASSPMRSRSLIGG